ALHRLISDSIGAPPASWGQPRARIIVQAPAYYAGIVRTHVAPVLAGGAAPRVVIGTTHGDIVLELASADAPLTVHNFMSLIEDGYFDGTRWHRVVPNFVIQDGDRRGDGSGGPGYAIRDEINPLRYERGTLGMALSGPDTGGSQFFITHSPQPHLDGGYTVFGRVDSGMDVVDRVVQDDPLVSMRVVR
ncbi:MAG: peptidylprolyl isomerase, partial [Longimicrobiales bacterium]